jgi:hypothetical protein
MIDLEAYFWASWLKIFVLARADDLVVDQVDAVLCEDGKSVMLWIYGGNVELMTYAPGPAPAGLDDYEFGRALTRRFGNVREEGERH